MHTITSLLNRVGRIEARRAAMATKKPAWAEEYQGATMARIMIRKLGGRVSQAHDPCWHEPMEMLPEGTRAMGRLALAILRAQSYSEAFDLAQSELDKLPPYRYAPRSEIRPCANERNDS